MPLGKDTLAAIQKFKEEGENTLVGVVRALKMEVNQTKPVALGMNSEEQPTNTPLGTGFPRIYTDGTFTVSGNTVTFSPNDGKLISLYTDDGWVVRTFEDALTLNTAGYVSNKKYDIFLNDDITNGLSLVAVAWTDENNRATALTSQDGTLVRSDDTTQRFLATGRYNGSSLLVPNYNMNGEIIFCTGDPHNNTADPATGVWMSAPGITIGAFIWQFCAILAGVPGVGFNNLGQLLAGRGNVIVDIFGMLIQTFGVLFEMKKAVSGIYQMGSFQLLPDYGTAIITLGSATQKTVSDYNFNSGAFGSGWTSTTGSPTFSSSNPISGSSYSMLFDASESITSDFITSLLSGYQAVVEMWIYDTAACSLSVTIEYYTAGGALLTSKSVSMNLEGSNTSRKFQLMFDGVAPITTSKAKLIIAGNATIYMQSVGLYQGTGLMILNQNIIGRPNFTDQVTFGSLVAITGNVTAANLSGTNTGDVTLTTVGSSPNGNAASLSGQQLRLQPADGSNPGVVTTGSQTFAGNKTFSGTVGASNLSGTNTGDQTLKTPLFGYGALGTVALSSTAYLGMGQSLAPSATEGDVRSLAPYTGTIKNLRLVTRSSQSGTGSLVVTARVANADTSITFTIAAGAAAGTFSDLSNTASVTGANALALKLVNNATAASAQIGTWSMEYDAS